MSKNRKADNILQALLTHRTIREAAEAVKVTERTIYNYLDDPDFSSRYEAARCDVIRGISNNLQSRMNEAINVISEIMGNSENKAYDRLSAARAILEYSARYYENIDLAEKLAQVERMIEKSK